MTRIARDWNYGFAERIWKMWLQMMHMGMWTGDERRREEKAERRRSSPQSTSNTHPALQALRLRSDIPVR
jgi:hypothetical protein